MFQQLDFFAVIVQSLKMLLI